MRKLLALLLIVTLAGVSAIAQPACVPDTTITETGISPAVLPVAVEGKPYDVCATILVPADTLIDIGGQIVPAQINFFSLDNVNGLPQWLNFACEPASCQFAPGYSCVKITGTPPMGKAGKYDLEFFITLSVTVPGFGTFPFPDTITGYSILVSEMCMPDTSYTEPGIYPDTLDDLCVGQLESKTVTINAPPTIPLDDIQPGLVGSVNFFTLAGINNLPDWMQISCGGNCTFQPGLTCVSLVGCPPCGADGFYCLFIDAIANVTVPGFGTFPYPVTDTIYFTVNGSNWATNINPDKATLNWKPTTGATGYEIEGGLLGSAPISINTGSATTLPASGLAEGACYYWRVRPTAGGQVGDWSCYDTFYTCTRPSNLTVTNLTSNSATLSYTPGVANETFFIAGRPNPGGPTSIVTINNGSNTSLNATGLSACQEYVWTAYAICEGGAATEITVPNDLDFFTTLGCPQKTGLAVGAEDLTVQIVPNPANHTTRLMITGVENENTLTVNIFDMTGKQISTYALDAAPYMSQLEINTSQFAKGVYHVITTTGNNSDVQKLVISR